MFLHIFRMRAYGLRRPGNDGALRESVRGWLDFRPAPKDSLGPRMEAHLRDGQGGPDLIAPLLWAQLRRVNGVLHLSGREECGRPNTKAKSDLRKQSWLCAVDPADALPLLDRVPIGEWDREIEDIPLDSPLWGAP